MEIRITMERPPRRSVRIGLVVFVVAIVVAVPVAWATDRFSDVPVTSPHHNDVSAIAGAGITGGCNPPTNDLYCPDQAVRRDQMASFLTRGLGRIAVNQLPLTDTVTRTPMVVFTPVAEVTIDVGGTGVTAKQYVKIDASIGVSGTSACPCKFKLRLRDQSTGQVSPDVNETVDLAQFETFSAVGVFDASPGSRTFALEMWFFQYAGAPPPMGEHSLFLSLSYLVATTYPFLSGSAQVSAAAAPAGK